MKKLHFLNIKGSELNREEMRNIMAGSGGSGCDEDKKCHGADANCSGICICLNNGPIGDNSTCGTR